MAHGIDAKLKDARRILGFVADSFVLFFSVTSERRGRGLVAFSRSVSRQVTKLKTLVLLASVRVDFISMKFLMRLFRIGFFNSREWRETVEFWDERARKNDENYKKTTI